MLETSAGFACFQGLLTYQGTTLLVHAFMPQGTGVGHATPPSGDKNPARGR